MAVVDNVSPEQLNNAYKKETDADVKERILLFIPFSLCTGTLWIVFFYVLEIYSVLNYASWYRRVRIDGHQASKVAEKKDYIGPDGGWPING